MASPPFGAALRRWVQSLDGSANAESSDGQLLDRYIQQRDETAFAALVRRHGPLVLDVCHKLLRDAHDADDAFQATFLVLACRAASIRRRESVAGFLYGVASRIARRSIHQKTRRRTWQRQAAYQRPEAVLPPEDDGETHALLHEELHRLPRKYRDVLILCYLQGKTHEEAAHELGYPLGSMSRHLSRARELLRQRLTARGVGAGVLALLGTEPVRAAVASALLCGTLDTIRRHALASALLAGTSPPVAVILAQGILRAATPLRWLAASLVLTVGLVFAGGMVALRTSTDKETPAEASRQRELTGKEQPRLDSYGDPLPPGALFRFGSVRMRHADAIYNSALSPDGKILATASRGSVILWDLAKAKPLRRFVCDHSGTFSLPGLVFSPNGKYLAYVQDYFAAYLWDVNTGKEIARFPRNLKHRHGLCQFTPDSEHLVLSDGPERVSFRQVQANTESRALDLEQVTLLSPDTRFCVRIEPKEGITFFDARTGKQADRLQVTASYNGNFNRIAFAPDSKSLAVAHQNKEIQIRDFPSGALRAAFPLPDSAKYRVDERDYWDYRLSFSTDGRTLLLGTKAGVVHRWDVAGHKEMPPLRKHFGAVTSAHLLPDGKTLVTTGEDGLIRRWENRTGRQLSEPPGYVGRTYTAYSPDGRLVAVGDARGRLELWNARNGRLLRVLRHDGAATVKLTFTPNGESLAEARSEGTIHFWAVPSGEPQSVLQCKGQNLRHLWSLHVSPDGRHVLVADVDYHASLWDRASGKQLWSKIFGPCAFSRDGKTVVTADGPSLHFLDAANGKRRATVRLNTDTPAGLSVIDTIVCSPDGQRLAIGMCFGTVYLCDAGTGAEIAHFQAIDAPKGPTLDPKRERFGLRVDGLSFSADSRWLCTSGSDAGVRLWEVATGREVLRRNGHLAEAVEVSFGADSRTVLSCGDDAQSYLWTLRPSGKQEANRSLDALWAALAEEPTPAYRALWTMSEAQDAVAFLRGKLVPVKPVANERLRQLIADLDSDAFPVRDMATKTLTELGEVVAPALRAALQNKPSLETRKRLEELLQRIERKTLSADELRLVRAIDVLERQNTAAARELLKALAAGASEALTTTAARAALKRLER